MSLLAPPPPKGKGTPGRTALGTGKTEEKAELRPVGGSPRGTEAEALLWAGTFVGEDPVL